MDEEIQPFNWHRLLLGEHGFGYMGEVALRCLMVFVLLLLVMRLMGKRGQANLSPMQQLLLIALGSAAGDTLFYPHVPITTAAIVLLGITGLTIALDKIASRVGPVRSFIDSHPRILVRQGRVDADALREERTTRDELYANLRQRGARSLSQVEYAILEVTGEISVFLNGEPALDEDLIGEALRGDGHHEPPVAAARGGDGGP